MNIFKSKLCSISTESRKKLRNPTTFLLLFSLVFVRYCYYGFSYFYQLDDYIQYHNYTYFANNVVDLIFDMGLLQARPAAGAADLLIWSKMFAVMLAAVAVISAMYVGAAMLLKSVFERHFRIGWVFYAVFCLLPLGIEGTYWVSASSRIVCGLFFVSLGAWLLQRYFDGSRWYMLVGALVLQLFGSCFYEQVLVFSVALFLVLGILNRKNTGKKSLWSGFSVANAVIYLLLTSLAPNSSLYSGRMEVVLPVSSYYYRNFLPEVLRQVKNVFVDGGVYTSVKGFVRGIKIMWQDHAVLYALIVILLCILFFALACAVQRSTDKQAQPNEKKRCIFAVLTGLFLAAAPLAPFFFLGNPWFSFRGAVASFAGLALALDAILCSVFSSCKYRVRVNAAISACIAFVFCVASVSEIHDYRQTTENDQRIVQTIVDTIDLSDTEDNIGIIGLEPSYLEDQNFYWHEHIHGVTESSWALTGLIQYKTCQPSLPSVIPLSERELYRQWNYETNRIDGFDELYYYDVQNNSLIRLTYVQTGEKAFNLYDEGGILFGTVTTDADGCGHFAKQ